MFVGGSQITHCFQLVETCMQKLQMRPGGDALVFQAGYHPRKRTFKTHPKHIFSSYKNRH